MQYRGIFTFLCLVTLTYPFSVSLPLLTLSLSRYPALLPLLAVECVKYGAGNEEEKAEV